jgi:hypothetical protein
MSLRIEIDQMVLDGLGLTQRENDQLRSAFMETLTSYFGHIPLTQQPEERWVEAALAEGELPLPPRLDAEETGRRLAHLVYGQIDMQAGDVVHPANWKASPGKALPSNLRRQVEAHLESLGIESASVEGRNGVDPSVRHEEQAQQAGSQFEERAISQQRSINLSAVRIHDDSISAMSAQALKARAYTQGHHIIFNRGQYDPGSLRGQRLLAHELAHVVHQMGRNPTTVDSSEPQPIQRQQQGRDDGARQSLRRRAVRLCQPADLQERVVEDWLVPYFRGEQSEGQVPIPPPYIYRLEPGNGLVEPDLYMFIVTGSFSHNNHIDIEVVYRYTGETIDHIVYVAVDLEERDGEVVVVAVWSRYVEGHRIEIYRQQARIVSSREGCRLVPIPFRRPRLLEPETFTPGEERLRELRRRRRRNRRT